MPPHIALALRAYTVRSSSFFLPIPYWTRLAGGRSEVVVKTETETITALPDE